MYYYIFEPPLEAKEYERTATIKEYLSALGIAGEMTNPTPGRSVEDLVELAIAKRYSTIIAVGKTELINRVARAIEPHEAVFGIIPLSDIPDISRLIGTSDWKSAAEQLKRRRWKPVRLGLINREICFLTPITLTIPSGASYQVKTPSYSLEASGPSTISIGLGGEDPKKALNLSIHPTVPKKGGFLQGLFGAKESAPQDSQFALKNLSLETSSSIPVVVANAEVCTTPIFCETQSKAVKLIVAKEGAVN